MQVVVQRELLARLNIQHGEHPMRGFEGGGGHSLDRMKIVMDKS